MKLRNLLLMLSAASALYACSGGSSNTNSSGGGIAEQDVNFVGTGTTCTTIECKPNVKLVRNGTDLMNFGKFLEGIGQQYAEFANSHYAVLVTPNPDPATQGPRAYIMNDGKLRPFNLGYYTQVIGVGKSMDDVIISPGVEVYNNPNNVPEAIEKGIIIDCSIDPSDPNCLAPGGLNNFWRGIENFTVHRSGLGTNLRFAVSQASPVRSIHFMDTPVSLCDWEAPGYQCGYTSGGFMANSISDYAIQPGSQQQWISRNSEYRNTNWGIYEVALWNSVFIGTRNTIPPRQDPASPIKYNQPLDNKWDNFPIVNNPTTTVSKEKPYLSCTNTCDNANGNIQWKVEVPQIRRNTSGIDDFRGINTPTELDVNSGFILISPDVYPTSAAGVTTLDATAINNINTAINTQDKNVIITPGVYNLDGGVINIARSNTIVLGIGVPSLECTNPIGCINVSATAGVDLAGFVMDAGYNKTPSLLQVGPVGTTSTLGDPTNPIFIHDVYFRVAETQLRESQLTPGVTRQTVAAAIINAGNVVGDNLWVWRADHDKSTMATQLYQDKASYGLVVYGDNVTMNGLAVEHFHDYQTVWYGKNGVVNFYQSEMPYDVNFYNESKVEWICHDPKTGAVSSPNVKGCPSYVVDSEAINHRADGLGVYTYFRDEEYLMATAGYMVPEDMNGKNISITHLMGKWLDGWRIANNKPATTTGYKNLVTVPSGTRCTGFGVNKAYNDKGQSQYSVLGKVDSNLTGTCN